MTQKCKTRHWTLHIIQNDIVRSKQQLINTVTKSKKNNDSIVHVSHCQLIPIIIVGTDRAYRLL